MKRLFGTDGIRAKYGEFPLTKNFVKKIGFSIGKIICSDKKNPVIYIAKDTRFSGDDLESFLLKGLGSFPVTVKCLGIIPTAALSYLTRKDEADLGIMISASHNLSEDNGIKLFAADGFKLADNKELEIERAALKINDLPDFQEDQASSKFLVKDDQGESLRDYIEFAKGTLAHSDLEGLRIVVDCSHGAVSDIADVIFSELKAEVHAINNKPDGLNINLNCGSQHPHITSETLKEYKADVGFSYDGDGDRVILVDDKANILDGDYIMSMLGLHLSKTNNLSQNTIVATVMSNMGLEEAMEPHNIKVIRTEVGDKKVVERMISENYNFGGEQSGHIVYLDNNPTGDGILTSLMILKMMKDSKKKLSELAKIYHKYPQILLNVRVKEKRDLKKIDGLYARLREFEKELSTSGRIFLRYSGTEPLARVMIEGKSKEQIESMATELASIIKNSIGDNRCQD
jgi:phosphoglucosamine mutase